MDHRIIQSFMDVLPHLKEILEEDVAACVTNTEKFLGYYPGQQMTMDIQPGMDIPEGDPLHIAIRENRIISAIIPEEVYGFPFKAVTYPLKGSDGEIIGAVGFARGLQDAFEIEKMSGQLAHSLEETNASVEEIASSAHDLETVIGNVVHSAHATNEKLHEIDDLLESIKRIARQSNILSLNASIEAARAGKDGVGFGVIAKSMAELSKNSAEAAVQISGALGEIKSAAQMIIDQISKTETISSNQAAATEEIAAALQEIASASDMLLHKAKL